MSQKCFTHFCNSVLASSIASGKEGVCVITQKVSQNFAPGILFNARLLHHHHVNLAGISWGTIINSVNFIIPSPPLHPWPHLTYSCLSRVPMVFVVFVLHLRIHQELPKSTQNNFSYTMGQHLNLIVFKPAFQKIVKSIKN